MQKKLQKITNHKYELREQRDGTITIYRNGRYLGLLGHKNITIRQYDSFEESDDIGNNPVVSFEMKDFLA